MKSLTILLVAAIVVFAGFKPAMHALVSGAAPVALQSDSVAALGSPAMGSADAPLDMPEMASPLLEPGANPFDTGDSFGSELAGGGLSFGRTLSFGPVEKLGEIIARDEEQATAVMKHWVKNG